jgi:DNA-binding response OmpR family regulator
MHETKEGGRSCTAAVSGNKAKTRSELPLNRGHGSAKSQIDGAACLAKVLVVDDDANIRKVIVEMLDHLGYLVDSAEDGETAWSLLSRQDFDILVTDHSMPRLSGLELLKRMRTAQLLVPVILISGNMPDDPSELFQFVSPGVVLEKPFQFQELVKNIRFLLNTQNDGGRF